MAGGRARSRCAWPSTQSCTRLSGTRTRRSCATWRPLGGATPRATSVIRRRWPHSRGEGDRHRDGQCGRASAGWGRRCVARTGTRAVGPTRAGAEIEWNKAYARELLAEVAPDALPIVHVVRDEAQAREAIDAFGSAPVVVKPSGLTGGKGVKVMGPTSTATTRPSTTPPSCCGAPVRASRC